MTNWLRPLLLIFYAPGRGMSEARDRARIVPAALLALLSQFGFALYSQWDYLAGIFARRPLYIFVAALIQSASSLLSTALIFVPAAIIIARLFDRRGSMRLALQREYASVACIVFYCLAASDIAAFPVAFLLKSSGWLAAFSQWYTRDYLAMVQREYPAYAALIKDPQFQNPALISFLFLRMISVPILAVLIAIGFRVAFRLTWFRTIVIIVGSTFVMSIAAAMFSSIIGAALASPFILILIFLLVRGYVTEAMGAHRARVSFKQNLEASTLNPADASAHYNLGLIHQQRNELDEATKRFKRAVEIDNEELDSHYQLGRIAREQKRYPDAIKHFEPVVANDPTHAQHEIWREIGATYLAAGQHEDALNAFERFLDQRQSDPEGLYLMGRTHAELGHAWEATRSMQACIEAVETSPAYKYRAEKRWLNQAQEFIRSSQ
jgi:tetratricopeptide (TPR) repeat protein